MPRPKAPEETPGLAASRNDAQRVLLLAALAEAGIEPKTPSPKKKK